jgi:hypothetical protein
MTTYTYTYGGYTHTKVYQPKSTKIGNFHLKKEYNVDIEAYEKDVKSRLKAKELSTKHKIPYSVAVKLKNAILEELLNNSFSLSSLNAIPLSI